MEAKNEHNETSTFENTDKDIEEAQVNRFNFNRSQIRPNTTNLESLIS
jgi:hypothetical protein